MQGGERSPLSEHGLDPVLCRLVDAGLENRSTRPVRSPRHSRRTAGRAACQSPGAQAVCFAGHSRSTDGSSAKLARVGQRLGRGARRPGMWSKPWCVRRACGRRCPARRALPPASPRRFQTPQALAGGNRSEGSGWSNGLTSASSQRMRTCPVRFTSYTLIIIMGNRSSRSVRKTADGTSGRRRPGESFYTSHPCGRNWPHSRTEALERLNIYGRLRMAYAQSIGIVSFK